ncbi:YeiH family protein [Nocardioides insulae]|uniref:YeiH family protein n=1 Tax=Nocardioides insulae TaxID=394734 RepID=UPI000412C244|nr:putative sulfate exporter family transporter [Nocardioides insulae]
MAQIQTPAAPVTPPTRWSSTSLSEWLAGRVPGWLPGLGLVALGALASYAGHKFVPAIGVLTWAVFLGIAVANLGLVPAAAARSLPAITKRTLRIGVVLLGFSLSLSTIAALGLPLIAVIVLTLVGTLVGTLWLGSRLRLGWPRRLLIATGFSICGASAIAAMEETARADEDDVAVSVALVTVCGTAAMVLIPLLQAPLGLTDTQLGIWAGASVHEVGQVVGAAGPAGATAVAIAIAVKLTRVLCLAPVVATFSALHRRQVVRTASASGDTDRPAGLPPLVPLFVIGFLVCVGLRTVGAVPAVLDAPITVVQQTTLAAALFGMGTAVHVKTLAGAMGRAFVLAVVATLTVAALSLAGILLIA